MTTTPPRTPADERDEPFYVDSDCPDCDTELVLYDELPEEKLRESDAFGAPLQEMDEDDRIWYDEWVCPECLDGIVMDWPEDREI